MEAMAGLVWASGMDRVRVPEMMGHPREDQLQGTVLEQLAELSGRVCYDSLGGGRSSQAYHEHILECGHRSVYEHCPITIECDFPVSLEAVMNRPGIWVDRDGSRTRVTINLRAIYEYQLIFARPEPAMDQIFRHAIRVHGNRAAPQVIGLSPDWDDNSWLAQSVSNLTRTVPARDESERWVSFWLRGSRGFSHEQVRHGDWTAISQRSTRYVDESESGYVRHPLLEAYLATTNDEKVLAAIIASEASDKAVYTTVYEALYAWQCERGVDKGTARKQARGAARGYLGNALETQMIFSASISQWRHISAMRTSQAADGEIREIIAAADECLRNEGVL